MASRQSTPSEGEILESEEEKATKSLPSRNGISVDRQSRKRQSLSPSPSPVSSPRHAWSRTNSRSPSREVRGKKRAREDDYGHGSDRRDSRRFKVHYEDLYHSDRRQDDFSRMNERNRHSIPSARHSSRRDRTRHSYDAGGRVRSRSPERSNEKSSRHGGYGKNKNISETKSCSGPSRKGDEYMERRDMRSREQSVSDRGLSSFATASSRHKAEIGTHQIQESSTELAGDEAADKSSSRAAQAIPDSQGLDVVSVQPLDEAALIEARRKKREAIKAKYKGQETPALVQALDLNNMTAPASPKDLNGVGQDALQNSVVDQHFSPQTPKDTSGHTSPTNLDIDIGNLANSSAASEDAQEDGPSAADYDPTIDRQEDQMRQDQHRTENDISSGAYDETKTQKQDVLLPEAPAATKESRGGFDMFADEDDMFAEEAPTKANTGGDIARAAAVPRSQALDMSMLDDWDDIEGYYKVLLGELLDGRYHVQSNLGKGMFSGVVRALDQKTKKLVAIKLIRSNETMKKAGLKEIEILQKLTHADPEDKKHMIRLERHFDHKGHLCMVFENLSINLREVLKKFGRDVGINLRAVRTYAQQMFLGLSLLRKCNILHADLKPDNILVNESRNMLKICDLGSASDASENEITPYLVSRFYRAPEIMLGLPYDFSIDIWSIGCTLFELYTGKILFTGPNNNQMLRSIMECRGKFKNQVLRKAQFASLHFDDLLNFRSVEKNKISRRDELRVIAFGTKPEKDLRKRLGIGSKKEMSEGEKKDLELFADLLDKCLNLNPEKRCTPLEALRHPFIMRKG